jgi:hypothetical protein
MPGSQDRRDQAPGSAQRAPEVGRADTPRPDDLPARGSKADLRQRLEWLPAGHPSSPYNDDGTRKLPVPRLKELELPLPGHERDSDAWPGMGGGEPGANATPERNGQPRTSPRPGEATGARRNGEASTTPRRHGEASTTPRRNPEAAGSAGHTAENGIAAERGAAPSAPERGAAPSAPERGAAASAAERNGDVTATTELNLTGTSAPEAVQATADEPRTAPDGSWDWKGLHLTPAQSGSAERAMSRCAVAEGRNVFGSYGETGLTPTMRQIEASVEHGRLVPETEEMSLKSPDRFREKLARMLGDEPGSDPDRLAASIHDGIRYTYLFDGPNYVRGVLQARSALEEHGNELLTLRNTWASEDSKGINGRWRQRGSDQLFEVQFHTPESWEAKQRTRQAYEEITSPATPTTERQRLRAYQREVTAAVPVPPHAPMVADYRKDG